MRVPADTQTKGRPASTATEATRACEPSPPAIPRQSAPRATASTRQLLRGRVPGRGGRSRPRARGQLDQVEALDLATTRPGIAEEDGARAVGTTGGMAAGPAPGRRRRARPGPIDGSEQRRRPITRRRRSHWCPRPLPTPIRIDDHQYEARQHECGGRRPTEVGPVADHHTPPRVRQEAADPEEHEDRVATKTNTTTAAASRALSAEREQGQRPVPRQQGGWPRHNRIGRRHAEVALAVVVGAPRRNRRRAPAPHRRCRPRRPAGGPGLSAGAGYGPAGRGRRPVRRRRCRRGGCAGRRPEVAANATTCVAELARRRPAPMPGVGKWLTGVADGRLLSDGTPWPGRVRRAFRPVRWSRRVRRRRSGGRRRWSATTPDGATRAMRSRRRPTIPAQAGEEDRRADLVALPPSMSSPQRRRERGELPADAAEMVARRAGRRFATCRPRPPGRRRGGPGPWRDRGPSRCPMPRCSERRTGADGGRRQLEHGVTVVVGAARGASPSRCRSSPRRRRSRRSPGAAPPIQIAPVSWHRHPRRPRSQAWAPASPTDTTHPR